MMISARKKIIRYILYILPLFMMAGNVAGQVNLFPDRSSCLSGDTVWFYTFIDKGENEMTGNVVHVQLDNHEGNHITKSSILCNNIEGHGYLPIPDSLSTGIYFLKAFTVGESESQLINQRLLMVYNRFENNLRQINFPELKNQKKYNPSSEIVVNTEKENYKTRESVNVEIKIPEGAEENIKTLFISAGLTDPLTQNFNNLYIPVKQYRGKNQIVEVVENDGVFISGKVFFNSDNIDAEGTIVILSIPDVDPYFDYCITNSEGLFYFYLKNARGMGNFVLQALSNSYQVKDIELFNNYIDTQEKIETESKILTLDERAFVSNLIDASYYDKLFADYTPPQLDNFSIKTNFIYPFYGEPTTTVYTEQFIDLPDFTEISRELLHGVQFRTKKDGYTIRLHDFALNSIFKQEPLKLLDGVPFFDPGVLSSMGSNDISKIDAIFYKRFFGDLTFNGVLSIYTKNKSIDWIESVTGAKVINYNCLQPETQIVVDYNIDEKKLNIPDFRKVFYREILNEAKNLNKFNFSTSDISGEVEIRVIAVTQQNEVLFSNKIIEVK